MSEHSKRSSVRDLVFEYLERCEEEDAREVLEAICAREPQHASSVRERVRILTATGLAPGSAVPERSDRIGGFELVERIGGGGMGVVYRARDASLGREVALKLVRPGELDFAGARERFRREAEAVARLAHPGIVPVHAAGEDGGVPYFAMECIIGCTLAEAIARLVTGSSTVDRCGGADLFAAIPEGDGDPQEPPPLFDGTWVVVCARIAREIAEALEHAHRRGVLHRDVKPSNMMITRSGRVMLIDFGLAAAEGQGRITRTGSAMGSFPYQSPEQLVGDWGQVDRRSDVYGLGVSLYELLTLELPYEDETITSLLMAARSGAASARRGNPRVPWELDTIVAAAMAPERERRYPSAAAMATDLSAALEGRPIAARRAGALRRTRRWASRHPAAAALLMLAAIVAVVGPLVFGFQERRARVAIEAKGRLIEAQKEQLAAALSDLRSAVDDARVQRDEAVRQEQRAERNFERALAAVDTMLTRVAQEELRDAPGLHALRRAVLEDALGFYLELLDESGSDPAVARDTARAWRRTGELHSWLDDARAAEVAFGEAIRLLSALRDEQADSAELVVEIATLRGLRMFPLRQLGRVAEAERSIEQAIDELGAADAAAPAQAAHRFQWMDLVVQRANLLRDRGRWREARAQLQAVLPELEEAHGRNAEDRDLTSLFAQAHHLLGVLWAEASSPSPEAREDESKRAEAHHTTAVELLEPAVQRNPGDVRLRQQLARGLMNAGSAMAGRGELDAATPWLARGAEESERLCRDYPGVATHVSDRGVAAVTLGAVRARLGFGEEGLELLRSGVADFAELSSQQPEHAGLLQKLAGGELQEGMTTWAVTGDAGKTLPVLDRAIASHERALRLSPGMPQLQMGLAWCHEQRSWLLLHEGTAEDAAEATRAWAEAMPDRRERVRAALRLALCAERLPSIAELSDADRGMFAARWDRMAAALIEDTLAAGVPPEQIRADPTLAPLLARPDAVAPLFADR